MIVKYKLNSYKKGLETPYFVDNGGTWSFGDEYIGFISNSSNKYIPKTLSIIPREVLVFMLFNTKYSAPVDIETGESIAYTIDELTTIVNKLYYTTELPSILSSITNTKVWYIGNKYINTYGNEIEQTYIDEAIVQLEDKCKAETLDYLLNECLDICDNKSADARFIIGGFKISQEQLYRYEVKYNYAKEYLVDGSYSSELQTEADVLGITLDEFAQSIVDAGDLYYSNLANFLLLIEAFRVKFKSLIGVVDNYTLFNILESAKLLDETTDGTTILALFEGL